MAKHTGKVREFCQSGKVGTMQSKLATSVNIIVLYNVYHGESLV